MARDDEQAMSAARLAGPLSHKALTDATANLEWVISIAEESDISGAEAASLGLTALLAEVERLQAALAAAEAREAALVAVVETVDSLSVTTATIKDSTWWKPYDSPVMVLWEKVFDSSALLNLKEQARALLASAADERSGGDGA